jgi:hypothetical protein
VNREKAETEFENLKKNYTFRINKVFRAQKFTLPIDEYDHYKTQILFLGSLGLFSIFWTLKASVFFMYRYIYNIENSRSMKISYDLTDVGAQIPLLTSEGLFSTFRPLKVQFIIIYRKFLIDGFLLSPLIPSLEVQWVQKCLEHSNLNYKIICIIEFWNSD